VLETALASPWNDVPKTTKKEKTIKPTFTVIIFVIIVFSDYQ
jgi:hypothetical protein